MPLSEIQNLPKDFLTAVDIAPCLGTDPNLIRWQAQNEPDKLGFPVVVIKSRVKIPKIPFLRFMGVDL